MPEWDAEIEVDEVLAARLIRDSYPELDVRSLRKLGVGWDNTVWSTRDGVAFRFPRRKIALAGISNEMRLLPQIAPDLPFEVPDAAYPGCPSSLFPWPWFGSRLIAGREISEGRLGDVARERLAGDLGRFLGHLHQLAPPALDSLAVDPNIRANMASRIPRTRIALGELDPSGVLGDRAKAILTDAEHLPPPEDLVLAHAVLERVPASRARAFHRRLRRRG